MLHTVKCTTFKRLFQRIVDQPAAIRLEQAHTPIAYANGNSQDIVQALHVEGNNQDTSNATNQIGSSADARLGESGIVAYHPLTPPRSHVSRPVSRISHEGSGSPQSGTHFALARGDSASIKKLLNGFMKLTKDQERAGDFRVHADELRRKYKRYRKGFRDSQIAFVDACPSQDPVELRRLSKVVRKKSNKLDDIAGELETVEEDLNALEFGLSAQLQKLQFRWRNMNSSRATDSDAGSISSDSSSSPEILYYGPEYVIPPSDPSDLELDEPIIPIQSMSKERQVHATF
jgi:hypothetical protein